MPEMEAVIFCGIQASGKSTFYKERFFGTHARVSLDLLRTRHREACFLELCIKTGQPFVVDNTNPTRAEREVYIQAAKARQFKIIGYYFRSAIEESLQRNRLRSGRALIPDKGLKATHRRLEIPAFEEGFDELYYVEPGEGGFLVKAWEAETSSTHDPGL